MKVRILSVMLLMLVAMMQESKRSEPAIAITYGFQSPIQWQALFLARPSICRNWTMY